MIEPIEILLNVGFVIAGLFIYRKFVEKYDVGIHIQNVQSDIQSDIQTLKKYFNDALVNLEKRFLNNQSILNKNISNISTNHLGSIQNELNNINQTLQTQPEFSCSFDSEPILNQLKKIEKNIATIKTDINDTMSQYRSNGVYQTKMGNIHDTSIENSESLRQKGTFDSIGVNENGDIQKIQTNMTENGITKDEISKENLTQPPTIQISMTPEEKTILEKFAELKSQRKTANALGIPRYKVQHTIAKWKSVVK